MTEKTKRHTDGDGMGKQGRKEGRERDTHPLKSERERWGASEREIE